jgi:hypothetical protein
VGELKEVEEDVYEGEQNGWKFDENEWW